MRKIVMAMALIGTTSVPAMAQDTASFASAHAFTTTTTTSVPGAIGAFAQSINGVPPVDMDKKVAPGQYVSATASSTQGGVASASASAYNAGFSIP